MPSSKSEQLNREIAHRIRTIRENMGWSLDTLAKNTGFAKSYLSQIENSKKEPPISTLTKIAHALDVDVISLITGQNIEAEKRPFTLVRANERKTVTRPDAPPSYIYESLTYKRWKRLMDGYLLTAGFEFPPEPMIHEGEEFVFMLEGKQEFIYDGKVHIIEKGDCLYFDSNRPHYSRSIGDVPSRFIVVFCSRKEE